MENITISIEDTQNGSEIAKQAEIGAYQGLIDALQDIQL